MPKTTTTTTTKTSQGNGATGTGTTSTTNTSKTTGTTQTQYIGKGSNYAVPIMTERGVRWVAPSSAEYKQAQSGGGGTSVIATPSGVDTSKLREGQVLQIKTETTEWKQVGKSAFGTPVYERVVGGQVERVTTDVKPSTGQRGIAEVPKTKNVFQESAQKGVSLAITDEKGKVIGYQDAKAQQSYMAGKGPMGQESSQTKAIVDTIVKNQTEQTKISQDLAKNYITGTPAIMTQERKTIPQIGAQGPPEKLTPVERYATWLVKREEKTPQEYEYAIQTLGLSRDYSKSAWNPTEIGKAGGRLLFTSVEGIQTAGLRAPLVPLAWVSDQSSRNELVKATKEVPAEAWRQQTWGFRNLDKPEGWMVVGLQVYGGVSLMRSGFGKGLRGATAEVTAPARSAISTAKASVFRSAGVTATSDWFYSTKLGMAVGQTSRVVGGALETAPAWVRSGASLTSFGAKSIAVTYAGTQVYRAGEGVVGAINRPEEQRIALKTLGDQKSAITSEAYVSARIAEEASIKGFAGLSQEEQQQRFNEVYKKYEAQGYSKEVAQGKANEELSQGMINLPFTNVLINPRYFAYEGLGSIFGKKDVFAKRAQEYYTEKGYTPETASALAQYTTGQREKGARVEMAQLLIGGTASEYFARRYGESVINIAGKQTFAKADTFGSMFWTGFKISAPFGAIEGAMQEMTQETERKKPFSLTSTALMAGVGAGTSGVISGATWALLPKSKALSKIPEYTGYVLDPSEKVTDWMATGVERVRGFGGATFPKIRITTATTGATTLSMTPSYTMTTSSTSTTSRGRNTESSPLTQSISAVSYEYTGQGKPQVSPFSQILNIDVNPNPQTEVGTATTTKQDQPVSPITNIFEGSDTTTTETSTNTYVSTFTDTFTEANVPVLTPVWRTGGLLPPFGLGGASFGAGGGGARGMKKAFYVSELSLSKGLLAEALNIRKPLKKDYFKIGKKKRKK